MIVGEAGSEIGLAVDRVIGEEDVVIKSMAENYRNVAGHRRRQHPGRRPRVADPRRPGPDRHGVANERPPCGRPVEENHAMTRDFAMTDDLRALGAALHQLFASATHDASAAMCRWTDGLITLTLDEVREIAAGGRLRRTGHRRRTADDGRAEPRRRDRRRDDPHLRRRQRPATGRLAAWARSRATTPSGASWRNRP